MSFTDKTLTCKDCGQEFIWTSGEQEFYQARGLVNEPGRCSSCRAARRAGGSTGGYGAGQGMSGPREFFTATCSNCGKECQVPFRPTNGKPVYCSDCFEKMGGRNEDRPQRSERPEFRAPSEGSSQNRVQFDELNAKLDRILGMLEPKQAEVVKEPVKAVKVKKAKVVASEE